LIPAYKYWNCKHDVKFYKLLSVSPLLIIKIMPASISTTGQYFIVMCQTELKKEAKEGEPQLIVKSRPVIIKTADRIRKFLRVKSSINIIKKSMPIIRIMEEIIIFK
jgi:hypothetical protein